jgi:molybdenum cofactor cytidylyltransferase
MPLIKPIRLVPIILAAGGSRRFNGVKLMSRLNNGKPLLEHSIQQLQLGCEQFQAQQAGEHSNASVNHNVDISRLELSPVTVILGGHHECLAPLLPSGMAYRLNPDWQQGLSSSIRVAVKHAVELDADAILLTLADQVALESHDYAALLALFCGRFSQGAPHRGQTTAAFYRQTPGVPAIFLIDDFTALSQLTADKGAKAILFLHHKQQNLQLLPLERAAIDIDTQTELSLWLADA